MGAHQVVVDHGAQVIIGQHLDFVDLVGGEAFATPEEA
jgi:hypothetical protein